MEKVFEDLGLLKSELAEEGVPGGPWPTQLLIKGLPPTGYWRELPKIFVRVSY